MSVGCGGGGVALGGTGTSVGAGDVAVGGSAVGTSVAVAGVVASGDGVAGGSDVAVGSMAVVAVVVGVVVAVDVTVGVAVTVPVAVAVAVGVALVPSPSNAPAPQRAASTRMMRIIPTPNTAKSGPRGPPSLKKRAIRSPMPSPPPRVPRETAAAGVAVGAAVAAGAGGMAAAAGSCPEPTAVRSRSRIVSSHPGGAGTGVSAPSSSTPPGKRSRVAWQVWQLWRWRTTRRPSDVDHSSSWPIRKSRSTQAPPPGQEQAGGQPGFETGRRAGQPRLHSRGPSAQYRSDLGHIQALPNAQV